MAKLDDILSGQVTISGVKYTMREMKCNGKVVWPLNYTYSLVAGTMRVVYSEGTQLYADGSNFAYVTATIRVYSGSTLKETRENEQLAIKTINNTSQFRIEDGFKVMGNDLKNTASSQRSCTISLCTYGAGNLELPASLTVTQQANSKGAGTSVDVTTGFRLELNENSIIAKGGTTKYTGYQIYTRQTKYVWTSKYEETETVATGQERAVAPASVTVSPSTGVTVNTATQQITFPANSSTTSAVKYTVTGTYAGYTSTVDVEVAKVEWDAPTVTLTYAKAASGYYIVAAGNNDAPLYPSVSFTQNRTDGKSISGSLSADQLSKGIVSGTATGDGLSASFSVSFDGTNSSGTLDKTTGKVTIGSRGTSYSTSTRNAVTNVKAIVKANDKEGSSATQTITQQANTRSKIRDDDDFIRFRISLDNNDFGKDGGSTYVHGYAVYDEWTLYLYASGEQGWEHWGEAEYEVGENSYTISVSPSTGVEITQATKTIKFPANTGTTNQSYTVTGTYAGYSDTATAVVNAYVAPTYEAPVVTMEYTTYGTTTAAYNIAASGGTVYPVVSFSQKRSDGTTITGSLSGGATSGKASDGSTFTVKYSGSAASVGNASLNASTGGVYIASRGTTPGDARTAASNVKATITVNGKSGDSGAQTVVQQLNRVESTKAAYTTYSSITVASFSGTSVSGTNLNTAKSTVVTVNVTASGTDYSAESTYTSGASSGGTGSGFTGRAITPDSLTVSGGTSVTKTGFTASNIHSESTKSYTVTAKFGSLTSASKTLTQAKDTYTSNTNYYCTLTKSSDNISAAGGEATFSASAYHITGTFWDSDGAVRSEGSRQTDTATLVLGSSTTVGGGNRWTIGSKSLSHDGMGKNTGDDKATVYAYNAADPKKVQSDSFSWTINNKRNTSATVISQSTGSKTYGTPKVTTGSFAFSSFSASKYTSSGAAASFKGISAQAILSWSGTSYVETTETPWEQVTTYTKAYYYTSGAHDDEFKDPVTETGVDTTSKTISNATPTFKSSQSWCQVSADGKVSMNARTSGGSAQSTTITASIGTINKTVTLYQNRYGALSVSPDQYIFPQAGGNLTMRVNYSYTTYTITHKAAGSKDPVVSTSKTSGGSNSISSYDNITLTANAISGSSISGTITITPDHPDLSPITIDTMQEVIPAGALAIYIDCLWNSAGTQITYTVRAKNATNYARPFNINVYTTTTTGNTDPSMGTNGTNVWSWSVNVPANTNSYNVGTHTNDFTKTSSIRWIRAIDSGNGLDTGWQRIEEGV